MTTPVKIVNGASQRSAGITRYGQLIVAPVDYDDTMVQSMTSTGTAYNFYTPKAGKRFVMTGFVAFADRSISDSSSTVIDIYEATSVDSTVIARSLFKFGMGKTTQLAHSSNIIANEGVWVNGKTDDNNILLTVTGYYLDSE